MAERSEMKTRSPLDNLIKQCDRALKTLVPGGAHAQRENPAAALKHEALEPAHRSHAAGLMRINHTGEVCAQALYQGQALTARGTAVRDDMDRAAREEIDHLAWCETRLRELGSSPSVLNPLWYGMSFGLGAAAGLAGDRWSQGFVAETETQVCRHLRDQLERLPEQDGKSRAVVEQMITDENSHAENARASGAAELPLPVKGAMQAMARIMKLTAYRL